jgi:DNA-binding MarR family transcriptional regulator
MSAVGSTGVLNPSDTRALMRLAWALDRFREVYPKATLRQASAFLAVAITPGYGPTEYAKALGTVQPVASRWMLDLGANGREHEGLGLLERRVDPENLRQIQYTLTPEGDELARRIAEAIRGRAGAH